jgi:hypothetical protein
MRRREVDLDALAAGFDDTSRGLPRPHVPEALTVPGSVVDSAVLLPPIQRTDVAPATHEPDTDTRPADRTGLVPTLPTEPLVPTVPKRAPVVQRPDPLAALLLTDVSPTVDDDDLASLRAPVVFRRRRRRARVRRVTRVVRHVDTWSVFKVALVFNLFLYLVCLTAGVLLWQVAYTTGTVSNVERFFEGFGWETFEFKGGEIYHNAWIAGVFVSAGLTGLAVLMATLFNLITDLVGGVRVTVLEEEVLPREERIPRRVARTPRRTRPAAAPAEQDDPGIDGGVDGGVDGVDDSAADSVADGVADWADDGSQVAQPG